MLVLPGGQIGWNPASLYRYAKTKNVDLDGLKGLK